MNVGILGCGKMGKVYARWFSLNPNTKVKAVYNRTFSTAGKLAAEYEGCEAVREWESIVRDEKIDIVGICTPSSEHYEQVLLCAQNKKNILLEKPMSAHVLEAQAMKRAVQDAQIKMLVGFQMRFHPVVQRVGELLRDVGKIYTVDFYFGMYRPEVTWRHAAAQGGGVFKELGSHLVDIARMWLGEVEYTTSVNRVFQKGRDVEDFCSTILEFKNGACTAISCNYWDRESRAIRARILAENCQINFSFSSYDPADSRIEMIDESGKQTMEFKMPPAEDMDLIYPGHLDSFKKEIDSFVDCILEDRDIRRSAEDGLRSMEIIDAAYCSQRRHSSVGDVYRCFQMDDLSNCFVRQEDR